MWQLHFSRNKDKERASSGPNTIPLNNLLINHYVACGCIYLFPHLFHFLQKKIIIRIYNNMPFLLSLPVTWRISTLFRRLNLKSSCYEKKNSLVNLRTKFYSAELCYLPILASQRRLTMLHDITLTSPYTVLF